MKSKLIYLRFFQSIIVGVVFPGLLIISNASAQIGNTSIIKGNLPGSLQTAPPTLKNASTPIFPMICTDKQKVQLVQNPSNSNVNVGIIGFRYNQEIPQRDLPEGRGKEKIYTKCIKVRQETFSPIESNGPPRLGYFFDIPEDAPSAEYFVRVFSGTIDCNAVNDSLDKIIWTGRGSLFITPSYIISKIDDIKITGNSENPENSPSEMAFTFSSVSSQQSGVRSLVEPFGGSYPSSGNPNSNWITPPDSITIHPDVPVFVGRESLLNNIECLEEAKAFPSSAQTNAEATCATNSSLMTNSFQTAISGMEFDEGPSKIIGALVSIGVGAAVCYAQGIACATTANATLAISLANKVNNALKDDDDKLGTISRSFQSPVWEIGTQRNERLSGGENGPVDVQINNYRMGAPRVLNSKASIKSIQVLDGYDSDETNEIFINTNGFLYTNGLEKSPSGSRYPLNGSSFYNLKKNETKSFGTGEVSIFPSGNFSVQNGVESPLMYIEMSVWEHDSDDDNDLMGIFSQSICMSDFLSAPGTTSYSSDGQFIKTVRQQFTTVVNGYDNYVDFQQKGFQSKAAYALARPQQQKGKVLITYEVEATWLMSMARTLQ